MASTTVKRGLGDRPGAEISDPLLTHERAREARGRYACDTQGRSVLEVRGDGFYFEDLDPGMLVEIADRRGRLRRGMVDEVEDVLRRGDERSFSADTNIVIEAEL